MTAHTLVGPLEPGVGRAGALAQWSGALWLTVVATWWIAGFLEPVGGVDPGPSAVVYGIGYSSLIAAEIMMVMVARALVRLHGGLGARGVLAPALISLAVPTSVVAVFYVGWGSLVAVGCVLIASAMLQRGQAPLLSTLAVGGGLLLGAITWAVLRAIDGTLFEYSGLWGTSWLANLIGVSVGATVLALGLLGIGHWLRKQQVAKDTGHPRPVVA